MNFSCGMMFVQMTFSNEIFIQSDGEVPLMLEPWGMWSTPSLPSLPDPLRSGVIAPDRVLSIGQIELNCALILNWIVWSRTVYMDKNGFGIK